jgi:hypothetical protein
MRLRELPWLVGALSIAAAATAQEGVVRYDIEVVLDPVGHRLEGTQHVRWTNRTGVPTSELWWHLYLNAFASSETTFMRELSGGRPRSRSAGDEGWGWVRVSRMELADGTDLLARFEFARPDDDSSEDFTVARVELPRPVPPGSAVELELEFEAQLPEIVDRTGHVGDFHMVGQWFPKLGVFEGERGWNCHQFHAASEFFADYGSYRVEVTVPRDWVVGASGVEVEREVMEETQRLVFAADRVHDFAWCAAPDSLMEVVEEEFDPGRDVPLVWLDRARETLGLSAADLELPPMYLRLLVPRSQLDLAERMLRSARLSVAWFGLQYGPYPYPQLTVVAPPPDAYRAGGMEYPTLITIGSSRLLTVPLFNRIPLIEAVTVHEFGHQYFYGIVGSNEFEEAWLDEGLTSFAENECVAAIANDGLVPLWRVVSGWAWDRHRLGRYRLPIMADQWAWQFRNLHAYSVASYQKTAVAMKTLQGLVGEKGFARAMRAYVDRQRFRHPSSGDLVNAFEGATGQPVEWFFEQAVRGDADVDWTVLRVRHFRPAEARGMEWVDGQWSLRSAPPEEEEDGWTVAVEIGRRGEFVGPVEVSLTFEDGRRERRTWDGQDRWVRWRFSSDERLTQVVVDPDGAWALETNRSDNYWRDRPNPDNVRRAFWWLPDALQMIGLLLLPWS